MSAQKSSTLANGDHVVSTRDESTSKAIRESLMAYKEVLIRLHELLTWKKTAYSYVIVGIVTVHMLLLWYLDLSALNILAWVALKLAVFDYIVPTYGATIAKIPTWTAADQKQYESVCQSLADIWEGIKSTWAYFRTMKNEQPRAYIILACLVLLMEVYITCAVNNMLLCYMTYLALLVTPGLVSKGLLQKHCGKFAKEFKVLFETKVLKKKSE